MTGRQIGRHSINARSAHLAAEGVSPNRICACCGHGPNDGCNPADCRCWPCVPLADVEAKR